VALDLSACTMSGTEFDPVASDTGTHLVAAKGKIVSLVLPDAATSVKAGSGSSNSTFKNFTTLTSVTGSKVETIGQYAFSGCTSLTEVNLPEATTISYYVFFECASLTEVNLPNATTIGTYAFSRCNNLTTLSLPKATSIGANVFYESFNGVVSLTIILGEAVPTLGLSMFSSISSAKSVTVQVPTGATGYGSSPTDDSTENWGNAFRGMGWNGSYLTGTVNGNISLTITYQ
jgi:hypothetical protein